MSDQTDMGFETVCKEKVKPLRVSRKEIIQALDKLERQDLRDNINKGWYSVEMISQTIGKTITKGKVRWLVTNGYVSEGINMNEGRFQLGPAGKRALSGREPMPRG